MSLIQRTVLLLLCFALAMANVAAQCTLPNFSVTEFSLPAPGFSIAVADFNRDGRDDVAVPDNTQVQILLSDGSGGFLTPILTPGGAGPKFVAVGEFDGDGRLDLAVAGGTATTDVTVLKGAGTGKFSTLSTVSLGTNHWTDNLAVGDVNNDGKADIVTGNFSSSYSVLLGDGTGGFVVTRTQINVTPNTIRLADFNRDGSLDIVLAAPSANQIALLIGNGNGTFGAPTVFTVGIQPADLAVGDFNRDGKLDVVTANEVSRTLSLLLGNGAGGFGAATSFSEAGSVHTVVAADFNGDGRLDVADTNDGASFNVSVRFGKGNGAFDPPVSFAISFASFSLAAGKFGPSCKPDLVMSLSSVIRMPVLFNHCP